jgi:hypothetical protein
LAAEVCGQESFDPHQPEGDHNVGCLFEQTGFNEVRSMGIKRESLVKTPCVSVFGALLERY